jgi:hypothetical protein
MERPATMNPLGMLTLVMGLTVASIIVAGVPLLRERCARARDVLVVIPARNEAAVIGLLIADLGRQREQPGRVVVIDDHSEDDTVRVAREAGAAATLPVEVRSSAPVPAGWSPKSWALEQGAVGDERRILFLDADVRLAPRAIGAVSAAHDRTGGLLSIAPRHDVGSIREGLSLPFNLVALIGAVQPFSRTSGAATGAFGPCLMIDRSTYEHIGGHRSVSAELLDDVALAHRVRHAGASVTLQRGGTLVRYRMYRSGREALHGWTRNIALGAWRTPPIAFAAVTNWVMACLLPLVWLITARDVGDLVLAGAAWAAVAGATAILARRIGRFGPIAYAATPLLVAFFVALTAVSGARVLLRKPARWRGRRLLLANKATPHG